MEELNIKFNNELIEIIKQASELIRMNCNNNLDVTTNILIKVKGIKHALKSLEDEAVMDLPF